MLMHVVMSLMLKCDAEPMTKTNHLETTRITHHHQHERDTSASRHEQYVVLLFTSTDTLSHTSARSERVVDVALELVVGSRILHRSVSTLEIELVGFIGLIKARDTVKYRPSLTLGALKYRPSPSHLALKYRLSHLAFSPISKDQE
jgi:hypothetical protein